MNWGAGRLLRGNRHPSPDKGNVWILLLILGAVVLLGLAPLPFADGDSPAYGRIARSMLTTGDWLTFQPAGWFLDKPPLTFWLMALSYRLLGASEVATRLWQVLLAIALVAVTYGLARAGGLRREEAALGALALETAALFWYKASEVQQDVALTLFLALALYALLRYLLGHGAGWSALAGGALGLATLSKGIVAPGFFALIAVAYVLVARRSLPYPWPRVLRHAVLASVVCAAVCLPWVVANVLRYGDQFTRTFLASNTVGIARLYRPLRPPLPYGVGLVAYAPLLLVGMLPWSPLLLLAVPDLRSIRRAAPSLQLAATWLLVVFVVLSVSRSDKELRFLYPALPAAAILVGRVGGSVIASPDRSRRAGWLALILALAIAVPTAVFALSTYPLGGTPATIVAPALPLFWAGLLLFALWALRREARRALVLLVVATLLAYSLLEWRTFGQARTLDPWRALSAAVTPYAGASGRVILYGRVRAWDSWAAWHFDLPVAGLDGVNELVSVWRRGPVLAVVPADTLETLTRALAPPPNVVYTAPAQLVAIINWAPGVR